MGILSNDLMTLNKYRDGRKDMLELGNQYLYIFSKPYPEYPEEFLFKDGINRVAKQYFEQNDWKHTSVDLNGLDGAEKIDLGQPFDLGRKFDCITDYGMSEHCYDLYQLYLNLHNHAKIGTIFFQENPLVDNWPDHGVHYRKPNFYNELCNRAGYKLIETKTDYVLQNPINGWNVYGVFEKISNDAFISRREFEGLPYISLEVIPARTQT